MAGLRFSSKNFALICALLCASGGYAQTESAVHPEVLVGNWHFLKKACLQGGKILDQGKFNDDEIQIYEDGSVRRSASNFTGCDVVFSGRYLAHNDRMTLLGDSNVCPTPDGGTRGLGGSADEGIQWEVKSGRLHLKWLELPSAGCPGDGQTEDIYVQERSSKNLTS